MAESRLDLDQFIPYRLSVLSNRVSGLIARLYADQFQLTIPEWRVLAVLGRYGPMTATDVAGRTAMDKVRVSRAIARLIDAGRIARQVDPNDRRRLTLDMAPAGREVYEKIVPLAQDAEARLLRSVTAGERNALDRLIAKLDTAVAQVSEEYGFGADPVGTDHGV